MKKSKFLLYLKLFGIFFKIGAFTFGGGLAMIPFMEREMAERHNWIDKDTLLDIVVVSESTPGPIAINAATFIGYKVGGFLGSVCATFGVVLPSFLIILTLSAFIKLIKDIEVVTFAFRGIRAGVLSLVIKACWTLFKQCPKDVFAFLMIALCFISVAIFDAPVLAVIILGAIIGLVFFYVSRKVKSRREGEKK